MLSYLHMKEKLQTLVQHIELNDISKSRFEALISDLSADVEDGQEIPEDILGVFPQEARQGIMIMILGMILGTIQLS